MRHTDENTIKTKHTKSIERKKLWFKIKQITAISYVNKVPIKQTKNSPQKCNEKLSYVKQKEEKPTKRYITSTQFFLIVFSNSEKAGGIFSSRYIRRETSVWSEEASTHLIFVDGHYLQAE